MWWSGKRWINDDAKMWEHAMRVNTYIAEEATYAKRRGDHELSKVLYKWAKASRSEGRISSMVRLATKHPLFRPNAELNQFWDGNPNMLGTPDGVFDLMKGQLLARDTGRNQFCSMTTNGSILLESAGEAKWGKDWAEAVKFWEGVLAQWHDDPDTIRSLQDIAGLCLRGHLDEHCFVLWGSGRSGKSSWVDAMFGALGDYAQEVSGDVIRRSKFTSETNKNLSIVDLNHKRMVKIAETGGEMLDTEVLKMFTGETTLRGRYHRANFQSSTNWATYIMMTNFKPDLRRDQTEAMRGRLHLIPWKHTFLYDWQLSSDEYRSDAHEGLALPRNDELKEMLTGRTEGFRMMPDVILTWAYLGLVRVMSKAGAFYVSDEIKRVTDAMWAENNPVDTFFLESGLFVKGGATVISSTGLHANMSEWARINDPEFAELISTPTRMGKLLSSMGRRGFEGGLKSTDCLWKPAGKVQVNAWRVPFTYTSTQNG
jgi:phage/plasmid-associated DNA primase